MKNSKKSSRTSKEDSAFSRLTEKILKGIACGKIKTRKFSLSELDA